MDDSRLASFESADGQRSVEFNRDGAGFVRFQEFVRRHDDIASAYWGFGQYSGLYASLEEAIIGASSDLPWFDRPGGHS
ncbi:hypothetical protein [Sphingomonas sp.]|jgi:hypothetical protein|uniref:hypothetical protein n=1 Tax=Sphingomonas sp. TaxID=28214 RepID=UPI002E32C6B7|nr:hypothetical protein [Sphingomonas sp.]HEX4695723.1 hypothetical protein [Sphingomonas sp.]